MSKNGNPLEWALAKTVPEPNSGCMLWLGTVDKDGYGKFCLSSVSSHTNGKTSVRAHRFIYEGLRGKIPDGMVTDHKCRVRSCCNPDHIEIVTPQENSSRQISNREACSRAGKKGSWKIAGINRAKTHCPHGHPYEGWNLIIFKSGSRACRTCIYRRTAEMRARQHGG